MAKQLPDRAKVVVVGGGIVGTSIAYHLPKFGIRDVVQIERKKLTSGTTWHAAGLIARLRQGKAASEIGQYTIDLIHRLEEETGQSCGLKQNGSYTIALDDDRFTLLKRQCSLADYLGISSRIVSPEELQEGWPLINAERVVGALWTPENGQVNPVDYTMAMAKGARQGGVDIFEDTKVTKLICKGDRVVGVETDKGTIEADIVVLACGMWTRDLARTAGAHVPLHATEHFYMVTEPISGLSSTTPVLVIPEERAYYKEDAGKLLVGFFEAKGKAWATHGIPETFEFDSIDSGYDRYEDELTMASTRVPSLESAGIQTFFTGPESFTADGRYVVGPAPERRGLFIAAGFNSSGIMSSGGMGRIAAEWIASGNSPIDMHHYSPDRTALFQANRHFIAERATESIGLWLNMPWPGQQMETGRGVRRLPLHHELKSAGARFGERVGWEFPLWFAPQSALPVVPKLGKQDWFAYARAESLAARDDVVIIDQSAYAKFIVEGKGALAGLSRVCANEIDVPIGRMVYTAWLNERGGFEADLTVTRIDDNRFLIVSGFSDQRSNYAWLREHLDPSVCIQDITTAYGLLSIQGPKSRALLQSLSDDDLSDTALPFSQAREIGLGHVTVRALRVTFVGERGYELLISTEMCGYVHEILMSAGANYNLRHAGLNMVGSCRLERGYRIMGLDIGPDDTPLEAGLGFAVAWDKPGGFIGRDVLLARRGKVPKTRLIQIALQENNEAPVLMGGEIIWRNGARVGTLSSGGWGFRLDRSLGMGYVSAEGGVSAEWVKDATYEIEYAGRKYAAFGQLSPFYDPKGERTRG